MFNILKETGNDFLKAVDVGATYVKDKTLMGGQCLIIGASQVGSEIVDASGVVIGHVSKTGEIIADTSLKAASGIADISLDTKEQVFSFIENNKGTIITAINSENTNNEFNEAEVEILVLKVIHGIIPFPLSYIVPEDVFIALGRRNYSKIKTLLGI